MRPIRATGRTIAGNPVGWGSYPVAGGAGYLTGSMIHGRARYRDALPYGLVAAGAMGAGPRGMDRFRGRYTSDATRRLADARAEFEADPDNFTGFQGSFTDPLRTQDVLDINIAPWAGRGRDEVARRLRHPCHQPQRHR